MIEENNVPSRRKTQRLRLRVPVSITGQIGNEHDAFFEEEAFAVEVSAAGGLLELRTSVRPGQWMTVRHRQTGDVTSCIVIRRELSKDGTTKAGVEFCDVRPKFWQIAFPPEDWFARPPAITPGEKDRHRTVSAEGRAYLQEEITRVISSHWNVLYDLFRKNEKLSFGRGTLRSATLVYVGPEVGYSLTLIGSPLEIFRFPLPELKRFEEVKTFMSDLERFIQPKSGRIEGLFCRVSAPGSATERTPQETSRSAPEDAPSKVSPK